MRAIQVLDTSGPTQLQVAEVDDVVAPPGHVLVAVECAGLSFPDLLLTRGEYQVKPPLPFILGAEVAGTVVSAPDGSEFVAGQRVAALPLTGGFAELVAATPAMVFPLPASASFVDGAAGLLNYLTADFALTRRATVAAASVVLVHGASGGVGTATTQIAKALGATVIGVVSSPEKEVTARAAGADHVVSTSSFRDEVMRLTSKRGVDIAVDVVGGDDLFADTLRTLAVEGQLLVVGFAGGSIPSVRVNRLLMGNQSVVGVGFGPFLASRPQAAREHWDHVSSLFDRGLLHPVVSRVLPMEQVREGLTDIESRSVLGKVVLQIAQQ